MIELRCRLLHKGTSRQCSLNLRIVLMNFNSLVLPAKVKTSRPDDQNKPSELSYNQIVFHRHNAFDAPGNLFRLCGTLVRIDKTA